MIIDFHTHCFPDRLALRAMETLQHASGGISIYTDGTAAGLLRRMDEDGVDRAVVLNIATNAHQQTSVNDFAASIRSDRLISFGSVHPDAPNALEELDRIASLGLRGIKFHPEYQNFRVDDEKMRPIYQKISRLGLPVVFHAGYDLGFAGPANCSPARLSRALRWLDTTVVAAHWGALADWESVTSTLCGLPLFFDTSFGKGTIPLPAAKKIVERHGTDKILFGSDCPWHAPKMDLDFLDLLELSESEKEAILHKNAEKILKLS